MPQFNLADYETVQARIATFWEKYPDGAIRTQLVSDPENFTNVVFLAGAYTHRDHPAPDATGYAAETKGSGGANNTAWHENGETSAIGRALANLGFATSHKERASREEMEKVNRMTENPQPMRTGPRKTSRDEFVQDNVQYIDATKAGIDRDDPRHPLRDRDIWTGVSNQGTGITEPQRRKIWATGMDLWPDRDACQMNLAAIIKHTYEADSSQALTKQQATQLIDFLVKTPKEEIEELLNDAEDYSDVAALAGS
jgi:hypothetical protein